MGRVTQQRDRCNDACYAVHRLCTQLAQEHPEPVEIFVEISATGDPGSVGLALCAIWGTLRTVARGVASDIGQTTYAGFSPVVCAACPCCLLSRKDVCQSCFCGDMYFAVTTFVWYAGNTVSG